MRRFGLQRARDDLHRLPGGAVGVRLRDEPALGHRLQDRVPPLLRALRTIEGGKARRRLDHAGDRRRLDQAHVADVFAEEQPRRFRYAVDREGPALSEWHVVQVELEDFVLREPALQRDRHQPLGELALRALLAGLVEAPHRTEERVADELLGDGAAAAQVLPAAEEIREDGAGRADDVDAGVCVEPAVLNRHDGLDHPGRDRGERHVAPLLAAFADERGEERRVERNRVERLLASDDLDRLQGAAAGSPVERVGPRGAAGFRGGARDEGREDEPDRLTRVIPAARNNREGVAPDCEFPRVFHRRTLCVSEIVETVDHLRLRDPLAAADRQRAREDARIGPLELSVHPRVDHPRELHVVVPDDKGGDDERSGQRDGGIELPAAPAEGWKPQTQECFRGGRARGDRCHRCGLQPALYTRRLTHPGGERT